jgi:3',5'-cyclic-AMP phosphodiesterase
MMLIAQISDFHVRAQGEQYEKQVPSYEMAIAAIAHINGLEPQPDLVVISGDLADDGSPGGYLAVREILKALRFPFLVLPGNHDDRAAMREAFADHDYLPANGPLHFRIETWPVRIIAMDTTIPGKHHGELDDEALSWLDDALSQDTTRPVFLFMHHHPFECGIPFLDDYRLMGAERVAGIVVKYPQVERVLCGHVHRAMAARFGGTIALSCPSTASQIALRLSADATPASYLEPPGGLLHSVRPGRPVMSHLFPIGDYGPAMAFF